MKFSTNYTGWLVGLIALAGIGSTASADTVIVYDASNSMWGQIEGEAKVTIARRVLGELVRDWDESESLGLVAYGHRREGDCNDIETVVAPGPVDRNALLAQIKAISPKGKTPLTAAVRHAAEALKYRDVPANVILISDGLETCNADPCAAASQLSEAGINFTAHVIGFDVGDADQEQLACIAENTGGRFFAARDAEGLQAALDEASEMAAEEVPEPEVTISAPESAVAGSNVEVSWQGEKIQPRDLVTIVRADAEPDARGDYKRVGDSRAAVLQAPAEPGSYEARYVASATGHAVAATPVELTEPRVEVTAPDSAIAGSRIEVSWTNTIHPRDMVTIVRADAAGDAYGDYLRAGNATSGKLDTPTEPGAYEVRYLINEDGQSIASAPITLTAPETSVSGPESAVAGSRIEVSWTNTIHPRDMVTIVPADAAGDAYGDYLRAGNATSGKLDTPTEPGDYEVRYLINEDGQSIASAPITLTAPETSVSGPESAVAGSRIEVSWTNTIHHRDMVTIVRADAAGDAYGDYLRTGNATSGKLDVPTEPGDYEVRYLVNEDGQSIASAPITLTAPETSVSGPESTVAGSRIEVSWTNTIHPRDKVTIVPADAAGDATGDYLRTGNASSGKLDAPAEPGVYELRYLLNEAGQSIASAPIRLTTPDVAVTASETVAAGSRFEVSWSATVHHRDKVVIVPAGAPADADDEYTRAGSGTSGSLEAPDSPGDYEVRYLLNASGRSIASTNVRVE